MNISASLITYDDRELKQNTEIAVSQNKEALVSIVEKELQKESDKSKLGKKINEKTNDCHC